MRSCIFVSYLAVALALGGGVTTPHAQQAPSDPDALYRDRERPESAGSAERIWAERVVASARDFEAAWKLSRVRYWLGTGGPGTSDQKKQVLEQGIDAARLAVSAQPGAVEGHFWMAANMGALAEAHGLRQGIRYRGQIKEALETALKIDPAYLSGSPDRALGRWYYKVPRLFGGDLRRSEEHLRKALVYKADSVISLLFLAETLVARDRTAEARTTLAAAIDAAPASDWLPEDARFKVQARALLASLDR